MKKRYCILLLGLLLVACNDGTGTTENTAAAANPNDEAENPQKFNDYLAEQQLNIMEEIFAMLDQITKTEKDSTQVYDQLEKLQKVCKKSIANTKAVAAESEEGKAFQKAALDLFTFYEDFANGYFVKVADYQFSEGVDEAMEEYIQVESEKFAKDEQPLIQATGIAQKAYARKHNILLQENQEEKKLQEDYQHLVE